MLSWIRVSVVVLFSAGFVLVFAIPAQAQSSEQLEVGAPPMHRVEPPAPSATPEELEHRADDLRAEKNFLDAIDYYSAAMKGQPVNASILNKVGICQLMLQRYKEAKRSFEQAIRVDKKHADAYNNLGVIYYSERNYSGAIKRYEKAIELNTDASSYYNNMGAAYFAKKNFEKAIQYYAKAMEIDPDIFERSSHAGVQARLPSPEDRAHYDYVLAKLYAKTGLPDRSLHYLKKAMEEGYKDIKKVYTDDEFAGLRKDPRFAELMAAKTPAIPN
jgi:tetratricopeptide (TPR) repeat protein